MPKFIRYKNANGETAECHPIPNGRLVTVPFFMVNSRAGAELPAGAVFAETEDEFLGRVILKDVPRDAKEIRIVDSADEANPS